jgi:uncharacterized membrane protein YjgN (DUF898 family)
VSDNYPGTEPAHLQSSPASGSPQSTAMPSTPRTLNIEFTGSGSEYFRIWLVNLFLIIVTLGLYLPWAKVRRLRYFYGNTVVDGEPLGFHGDPKKMFKGFLLVGAGFAVYSLAGRFSPIAGFVAFLVLVALWPALYKSSLQFRLSNTSWRGLRFGFNGGLKDAYMACVPLFVPSIAILGLVAMTPELQNPVPGQEPNGAALGVLGIIMVGTVLLMPWMLWKWKQFQQGNYRLGQQTTQFSAGAGSFYWLTLKIIGLVILAYVLIVAVVASVILGGGVLMDLENKTNNLRTVFTFIIIGVVAAYLIMALVAPYVQARMQNLVWNHTHSPQVKFSSTLSAISTMGLSLKNWVIIILTLGLYWPFAKVAMTRLRLEAVQINTTVPADGWSNLAALTDTTTTGEAAGDFFGFDIGL